MWFKATLESNELEMAVKYMGKIKVMYVREITDLDIIDI